MADPSEDDVPTVTSAAGDENAADADDRTIQQAPESEPDADPTTAIARPPVALPRPRAPSVPFAAEPPTQPKLAGDALASTAELEESVTATAPRVPAPGLALSPPKSVEIRTLEDDDEIGEETEVRTLAGTPSPALPSVASEADAPDDSVTTQAPRVPSSPDVPAEPAGVIRISPKSLMPAAGTPRASDVYDDESVTSRGPAVGSAYADDSVTTQAPSITAKGGLPPAIDGETEGTTKKVRKRSDDDVESITTQAPGHLTNMLRVIAADKSAPAGATTDDDDPDDPIQAHTQVMVNAPLKPTDLGAHVTRNGAALARELEPTSESGLRVAQPEVPEGDRASMGALGVPPRERRISNMAVVPPPDSGRNKATQPPAIYVPSDLVDGEKKPPYALLVGVVALISVAIPAVLFIVLNQSGGELVPRVAAQPSPDPVTRADAPRARAKPSAAPSASTPKRWPLRR